MEEMYWTAGEGALVEAAVSRPVETLPRSGLAGCLAILRPQSAAAVVGPALDSAQELHEAVEVLRGLARVENWIAALKARTVASILEGAEHECARQGYPRIDSVRISEAEVGTALTLPPGSARRLTEVSEMLVRHRVRTLEAMESGELSYQKAVTILEQTMDLPDEAAGRLEEQLLAGASESTNANLARRARRARLRMDPESLKPRRRAAVARRRVAIDQADDGMCWLSAYLPAEVAEGIDDRLTGMGRALQVQGEKRTLSQLRADILADLLVDGVLDRHGAQVNGVRATVAVTVPVLTAMGLSEEPAELEGYGPVPADVARRLAAGAPSFFRILTHPHTGVRLSYGKERYAVPADLKRMVRHRDTLCRFPGCRTKATGSDIDHTHEWARGGATDAENLAHLCRRHHVLKHQARWRVKQIGNGVLEWTSPAGMVHRSVPDSADEPPSSDPQWDDPPPWDVPAMG